MRKRAALERGITAELVGGLGNQLFTYAAAYSRSRTLDCPLYIDTTWYQGNLHRRLELNQANIAGTYTATSPILRKVSSVLTNRLFPNKGLVCGTFIEKHFEFDDQVLNVPIGTSLRGYFQSWKYFESSETQIRNQVRSLRFCSNWYNLMSREFATSDPWVAIHVRRGDYLNPGTNEFHGILQEDYYRAALEIVNEVHGVMPIKVFSDDILAAKSLLSHITDRLEFVNPPVESSSLENLLLMSQASGIITANSSFSWWAAWVGHRFDRTVIVPDPWFQKVDISNSDLFPDSWTLVNSGIRGI